jgi:hypothetical protein
MTKKLWRWCEEKTFLITDSLLKMIDMTPFDDNFSHAIGCLFYPYDNEYFYCQFEEKQDYFPVSPKILDDMLIKSSIGSLAEFYFYSIAALFIDNNFDILVNLLYKELEVSPPSLLHISHLLRPFHRASQCLSQGVVQTIYDKVVKKVAPFLKDFDMNDLKLVEKRRIFSCFRACEAIGKSLVTLKNASMIPSHCVKDAEILFELCVKLMRTSQLEKRIMGVFFFPLVFLLPCFLNFLYFCGVCMDLHVGIIQLSVSFCSERSGCNVLTRSLVEKRVVKHELTYPSVLTYACECGADEFSRLCDKYQLFQLIFGESMHEQIVARSLDIIKRR